MSGECLCGGVGGECFCNESTEETEGSTTIQIDFTGDELIQLGKACKIRNMTFSEFISYSIEELVKKVENEESEDLKGN